MPISRYQKIYGVGPLAFAISLFFFSILWVLDRKLGHLEISTRQGLIRAFGVALICIWIGWHTWCIVIIRRWWRGSELCTTGPYRFVRHPIYAGAVLLAFPGVCLLFNSWIMLLGPVLQFVVLSLLVRNEEAMMAGIFGERYLRYAEHTGRLFPRF
jgi:protein-S-isoprenylcysteine O-methyltransferase Ste14